MYLPVYFNLIKNQVKRHFGFQPQQNLYVLKLKSDQIMVNQKRHKEPNTPIISHLCNPNPKKKKLISSIIPHLGGTEKISRKQLCTSKLLQRCNKVCNTCQKEVKFLTLPKENFSIFYAVQSNRVKTILTRQSFGFKYPAVRKKSPIQYEINNLQVNHSCFYTLESRLSLIRNKTHKLSGTTYNPSTYLYKINSFH